MVFTDQKFAVSRVPRDAFLRVRKVVILYNSQ
jgi:hypothetical protein